MSVHGCLMVSNVLLTSPSFLAPATLGFNRLADATEDSAARLAGGVRILRAGDDSAALSTAQRLRAQVVDLEQSARNVAFNDSLVNVALSAVTNIQTLVTQASTLATQANSNSTTDTERAFLQQQFTTILAEIDQIAADATFDNRSLLDGTFASTQILVGAGENDTIDIAIPASDSDSLFSSSIPDLSSQAAAAAAITQIDTVLDDLNTTAGALAGVRDRLLTAETSIRSTLTGVTDARDALENINPREELLDFTLRQIQVDVAISAIAQAQRLSTDALSLLNSTQPEITGQDNADEADNTQSTFDSGIDTNNGFSEST